MRMVKNKIKIPRIKKDLHNFLLEEEGKISRKSIIDVGLFLITVAVYFDSRMQSAQATGTHSSAGVHTSSKPEHCSHSAHSAHGSHGSHGSHCSSKMCW